MNIATIRVEGTEEALDSVCEVLDLEWKRWKKGEPRPRGRYYSSAGLYTKLADVSNPGEMIIAVRGFLAKCEERNVKFCAPDLTAELSLGVTVGDSEQFIAFVDLSASDIQSIGRLGIALSIAAYPTSDKANAIEESRITSASTRTVNGGATRPRRRPVKRAVDERDR